MSTSDDEHEKSMEKLDRWWREKTPAGQAVVAAFEAQLQEMGVVVADPDDKR